MASCGRTTTPSPTSKAKAKGSVRTHLERDSATAGTRRTETATLCAAVFATARSTLPPVVLRKGKAKEARLLRPASSISPASPSLPVNRLPSEAHWLKTCSRLGRTLTSATRSPAQLTWCVDFTMRMMRMTSTTTSTMKMLATVGSPNMTPTAATTAVTDAAPPARIPCSTARTLGVWAAGWEPAVRNRDRQLPSHATRGASFGVSTPALLMAEFAHHRAVSILLNVIYSPDDRYSQMMMNYLEPVRGTRRLSQHQAYRGDRSTLGWRQYSISYVVPHRDHLELSIRRLPVFISTPMSEWKVITRFLKQVVSETVTSYGCSSPP